MCAKKSSKPKLSEKPSTVAFKETTKPATTSSPINLVNKKSAQNEKKRRIQNVDKVKKLINLPSTIILIPPKIKMKKNIIAKCVNNLDIVNNSTENEKVAGGVNKRVPDGKKIEPNTKLNKTIETISNKNEESTNSNKKKVNSKKIKSSTEKTKKPVKQNKMITNTNSLETKIKISNELKNLGIKINKTNDSDPLSPLLSSEIKTSISEMVKTKVRSSSLVPHLELNTEPTKNKTEKEKLVKKDIVEKGKPESLNVVKKVDKTDNANTKINENIDDSTKKSKKVESTSTANGHHPNEENLKAKVKRKYVKKSANNSNNKSEMQPVKRKYVKKIKISQTTEPTTVDKANKNPVKKDRVNVKTENLSKSEMKPTQDQKISEVAKKSIPTEDTIPMAAIKEEIPVISIPTIATKIKRKYIKKSLQNQPTFRNLIETKKSTDKAQLEQKQQIKDVYEFSNDENFKSDKEKNQKSENANTSEVKNCSSKKKYVRKNKTANTETVKKKIQNEDDSPTAETNDSLTKKPKSKKKMEKLNPISISSSDSSSDSDSDSSTDMSYAKPKKLRGPMANPRTKSKAFQAKRTRVASLNAIAKVHCLYENESRSALETNLLIAELATQNTQARKDNDSDDSSDEEIKIDRKNLEASKRSLRTMPGLRGIGKHWEMDDSMSSEIESDEASKSIKETPKSNKLPKKFTKTIDAKLKKSPKTSEKKNSKSEDSQKTCSENSTKHEMIKNAKKSMVKKFNEPTKRMKNKNENKNVCRVEVAKKRMASLNASAILAASYENDNYTAKHESDQMSSDDSDSDSQQSMKKEDPKTKTVKNDVKTEFEETRPKSTNVVTIDTDVTITGVYVNQSVTSQETYCKMLQYRTAYSVTEERVVRPPTQDPPKSYTPLSALSNMRPPGNEEQCPNTNEYQMKSTCDTSKRFLPTHQLPPQQTQASPNFPSHTAPNTSSAFYSPTQMHQNPLGYYQPAGPLITTHILQSQPMPPSVESEQMPQSAQPPQFPLHPAENQDNDVLITGDLSQRPQYRYGPPPPLPPPDATLYQRPLHQHQMHCSPYSNYYSPYQPQLPPPQEICYSPSYQPYYTPKIYQNTGPSSISRYYRPTAGFYHPSDIYDRPPPPPQNVPTQSGQLEMVTAGPSTQHMDHYSMPYYSPAYSPGGQCYGRSPYLDTPQYHSSSCSCPMQSCPKNVLTGPIIGSKTSKGPVSSSHLMTSSPLDVCVGTTPTVAVKRNVSCKMENILSNNILVSGNENPGTTDCDKQNNYEKIAVTPYANYSQIETTLIPVSSSCGIPLLPLQSPTVQHIETNDIHSDSNLSTNNFMLQKKARIGKSMERERQMMIMNGYQNLHNNYNMDPKEYPIVKSEFEIKKETEVKIEKTDDADVQCNNKFDTDNIKKENNPESITEVLEEYKDKDESEIVQDLNCKRKQDEFSNICLPMELDDFPVKTVKRRKLILDKPISTPKKSPPNSYKNLIKRSYPQNGTAKLKSKFLNMNSPLKSILSSNSLLCFRHSRRKMLRRVRQNRKHKKSYKHNQLQIPEQSQPDIYELPCDTLEKEEMNLDKNSLNKNEVEVEHKEKSLPENVTNLELTIERVAKGYFSEPEILSSISRLQKLKKQNKRSKSETNRSAKKIIDYSSDSTKKLIKTDKKVVNNNKNDCKNKNQTTRKIPCATNDNAQFVDAGKKKSKSKSKSNSDENGTKITNPQENLIKIDNASSSVILNETDLVNNNNECFTNNNKLIEFQESISESVKLAPKITKRELDSASAYGTKNSKRNKKYKYSYRKKHKLPPPKHLSELLVPKKSNTIPRWSNGWSWEGEPYQAYVFLNSDDQTVVRTCYPAMRHVEGDVVKPHDCVLLKASSKKNELPFVAKVAHLWENPEDGEMMMSIFWYYRPEHTKQGFQESYAEDEVFASKHKDHNSVATVEDKCFVLTYSEYCRYRRQLKWYEDNAEEMPSIVPKLQNFNDQRIVPMNKSPEQVMFCRQAYDFRKKQMYSLDKKKSK